MKLRARLDEANGHHKQPDHLGWNNGVPIIGVGPPKDIELKAFLLMDRWLARIEADKRDISKARKVVLDKPQDAVDACFVGSPGPAAPGGGSDPARPADHRPGAVQQPLPLLQPDPARCGRARDRRHRPVRAEPDRSRGLPAGGADRRAAGDAEDRFPRGVCDYSKPGVGQQHSVPWMTYEDGPGGRPLGSTPQSVPFGPPGSTSPSPAGGGTRKPGCRGKRAVRVRIRHRKGTRVRRVIVYVNGRKARTIRGHRKARRLKAVRLKLAPRKGGKARVLVVVRATRKGKPVKALRSRHTYRV